MTEQALTTSPAFEPRNVPDTLYWRLNKLRPHLRGEYHKLVGATVPGMDAEGYRLKVFDYERAPHIEKRGIESARRVVLSVAPAVFPSTEIFLHTCMQRTELLLHELIRPVTGIADDEERSFMYKTGVRKVIREIAGLIRDPQLSTWRFRRGLLDVMENELWKRDIGIEPRLPVQESGELLDMCAVLLMIPPSTFIDAFSCPMDLSAFFTAECGTPAEAVVNYTAARKYFARI